MNMADDSNVTNGTEDEEQTGAIWSPSGQLSYIGQDCELIPPHLANAHGTVTRRLDLSFNRLRSLYGLEGFLNVEELILDNNELADNIEFPSMNRLHTLMLNKNKISDLETLIEKINSRLPSLTYLSLLGNEACPNQLSSHEKDEEDYQRYRHYVLYRLPKLKFLDATAVKDTEKKEAKRQGPFLQVVRPLENSGKSEEEMNPNPGPYSPLPKNVREEPDGQATFGTCRYVYYGRHSEGNRFIRNNDL